ncbi:hypothetical protein J2847_005442 [Azospirillum agricola]|nr:hypothetical protein [Azospirillum agricola]
MQRLGLGQTPLLGAQRAEIVAGLREIGLQGKGRLEADGGPIRFVQFLKKNPKIIENNRISLIDPQGFAIMRRRLVQASLRVQIRGEHGEGRRVAILPAPERRGLPGCCGGLVQTPQLPQADGAVHPRTRVAGQQGRRALMGDEGLVRPPEVLKDGAEIEMGIREAGGQARRFGVMDRRPLALSIGDQRQRKVEMGTGVIGVAGDGAFLGGDGILHSSQRLQRKSQIAVEIGGRVVDRQRLFNQFNSFLAFSNLMLEDAKQMKRVGVRRLGVKDHPVQRFGLSEISLLMVAQSVGELTLNAHLESPDNPIII